MIDQSGIDQIHEGYFVDGVLVWGRWWWADDDDSFYYQGTFKLGRPHGLNGMEMQSNGEYSRGDYNNGQKIGIWKFMNALDIPTDEGMIT